MRKLRELLYAVEKEQTLGKARILRLYLDHAPWGAAVCGAQAAAQAVWLAAMLHHPALEARRWKSNGQIKLEHAQRVAGNLRTMKKAQKDASAGGPTNASW